MNATPSPVEEVENPVSRTVLALMALAVGLLSAACDAPGPSMAQLLEAYDMALLELQANPNVDLTQFEERYVWPFVPGARSNAPLALQFAAARYVLGTEVLRPSSNQRARIATLKFPYDAASLGTDAAYYQRTIELLEQRRLSVTQAFQIVDQLLRQRLAR